MLFYSYTREKKYKNKRSGQQTLTKYELMHAKTKYYYYTQPLNKNVKGDAPSYEHGGASNLAVLDKIRDLK